MFPNMALICVLSKSGFGQDLGTALVAWSPYGCKTFGLLQPATAPEAVVGATFAPSVALALSALSLLGPPSQEVPDTAVFVEKEYLSFPYY